jgi:predicted RNA-binding Zn ribbon-like protein
MDLVTGQIVFMGYNCRIVLWMTTMTSLEASLNPLLLGDHLALDLLNTQMMVEGRKRDLLVDDKDAARWLEQVGLGPADELTGLEDGRLLAQLRLLRDSIDSLVAARRDNLPADPSALNAFLRPAVPQLSWDGAGPPVLERFQQADGVVRRLSQIAFAAAQLLAEGDVQLLRKCESADCSLMFYDRTKSHKRRWCSMALCGNRHKVAEFRKRRANGALTSQG